MTVVSSPAPKELVTAGVLVIGDEILSGRTKDKNIGYIAEYLPALGIDLMEVRVVGDEESAVIDALNALRHRYTYVFTTGGIGPTHDDITADCVAKAFGVSIDVDPRALAIMQERLASTGTEMNDARLRMTRIPKGADLVLNKVSGAPGMWIGNVIVMAGVPSIMQAMLDEVAPKLKTGVRMLAETIRADAREGDIGTQLGEIAKANPEVAIGSYPFFDPQHGPNTNVVLRARDAQKLALAARAVEEMLERVRGAHARRPLCRFIPPAAECWGRLPRPVLHSTTRSRRRLQRRRHVTTAMSRPCGRPRGRISSPVRPCAPIWSSRTARRGRWRSAGRFLRAPASRSRGRCSISGMPTSAASTTTSAFAIADTCLPMPTAATACAPSCRRSIPDAPATTTSRCRRRNE